jgi:hypothetical protein
MILPNKPNSSSSSTNKDTSIRHEYLISKNPIPVGQAILPAAAFQAA